MKRWGQVSLEYLMITAFAFLFTIPLLGLFYTQSQRMQQDVTTTQVDRVASELADAADEVYYLGEPSKKTLKLYMPRNVEDIQLGDQKLVFKVRREGYTTDVVKDTAANLTGSVETFEGIHVITVQAEDDGVTFTE
jgi:uncharacterized protein (UPF0333 family)